MINKNIKSLLIISILFFVFCASEKKTLTADFVPSAEQLEPVKDEENKKVIFAEKTGDLKAGNLRIVLFESAVRDDVESNARKAMITLDRVVNIEQKSSLWRILIDGFKEKKETESYIQDLKKRGWNNAYIDGFKNEKTFEKAKIPETKKASVEFHIQLTAIKDKAKAVEMRDNLIKLGYKNIDTLFENGFWKVRAVKLFDEQSAREYLNELKKVGFKDAWIIKVR